MRKTIHIIIIACLIWIPTAANAKTINLSLSSHKSQTFTNDYLWTINATCTFHVNKGNDMIKISSINKNSSINGKNISAGHQTSINVKDQSNITVSAEPGAKVIIQNTSPENITANCSA